MTLPGWIFMSLSIVSVLTLVVCCYTKLLSHPRDDV